MIEMLKSFVSTPLMEQFQVYFMSVLFGGLIGIEREYKKQREGTPAFGGIRTFILLSLIGTVSADISSRGYSFLLPVSFLTVASFILWAQKHEQESGLTSEFAALLTYLVGILSFFREFQLSAVISIAVFSVLTFKKQMHDFVKHITLEDFVAFLKFAVVSIIIYPLFPDKPLFGVNLKDVWAMVVVISSIDFVGYILTKFVGSKKGSVITGLIGGLVSSTAVAVTLSKYAKRTPLFIKEYAAGIVGASAIMFLRILILIFIVSPVLLKYFILPCLMATTLGFVFVFKNAKLKTKQGEKIEVHNPYELSNALKFGFLFGVILFITKFAVKYAGAWGLFAVSAISGLSDVDAITLSLAKLSASNEIGVFVAVIGIFLAATVNTLFKWFLTLFAGDRSVFKETSTGFILLILGELTGIVLILFGFLHEGMKI
ncbi:MgtC/SapB family protein [Desulfurobacterium atlanticum]|uniref:Uncharacterized membrane protein, DUF4010 family n=1 Tax=Desulfurobacterium atlanticum TaxID=240169 RepID=A0A238ZBG5_9BACT|nr:MgtC/SapB family protein [Desulfurobacterium atlanticum]SNR80271.1 Uncharacterized membrane protein, DUF4010 family [Desulfurobacterium atlanticum]